MFPFVDFLFCVCACVCVKPGGLQVSWSITLCHFFKTRSPMEPEFTNSATQVVYQTASIPASPDLGLHIWASLPSFSDEDRNPESGPHACMASGLLKNFYQLSHLFSSLSLSF